MTDNDKMREGFGKWLVQRRLGRLVDFDGHLIDCTAVFWEAWQAKQSELAAEYEQETELLRAQLKYTLAQVADREARIRQLEAERVPEGWKLVPVEPTQEMLKAGERGIGVSSYVRKGMTIREYRFFKSGWDAMLAAAPEPKEGE